MTHVLLNISTNRLIALAPYAMRFGSILGDKRIHDFVELRSIFRRNILDRVLVRFLNTAPSFTIRSYTQPTDS